MVIGCGYALGAVFVMDYVVLMNVCIAMSTKFPPFDDAPPSSVFCQVAGRV